MAETTTPTAATPEELAKKLDHMSDISLLYSPNDAVDLAEEASAMIRAQAAQIAELTAERDAILSSLSEEDAERLERDKISRDNLRILDYIADKIGLPHDVELDESNFCTWFAPLEARATQAEAALAASQERERVMREALRKCISPFSGYAIQSDSQAVDVMKGFFAHIREVNAIARAALQPKEPSHDR